jgi:hypothetical protein
LAAFYWYAFCVTFQIDSTSRQVEEGSDVHFSYASENKLLLKGPNLDDLEHLFHFAMQHSVMNAVYQFNTPSGGYIASGFADGDEDMQHFLNTIYGLATATRTRSFMYIVPIMTSVFKPSEDCEHQIQAAHITRGDDDKVYLGELHLEEGQVRFHVETQGPYAAFEQAGLLSLPEMKQWIGEATDEQVAMCRNALSKFASDVDWDWPSFDVTVN